MEIKKIKYLQKDLYEVIIDDYVLKIPANLILKHELLQQKNISEKKFHKLQMDLCYYDELTKVLKFIKRRMRSKSEVEKFITNFVYQKDIISYLEKNKYIDDYKFAQAFINDKLNFTKEGARKIKEGLLSYQIDEVIIDEVMAKVDDNTFYEKLTKIVQKKIKQNKKYARSVLGQKILASCLSMGYEREMINEVFNENYFFNPAVIANEKQKLQQKYSDKTLIKNQLYKKGFSWDEIKKVID